MNPLSQQMQAQGRGNDSVLVHMSPREVGGLQALAQSYGGTLTRNPTTGLPEAGFLDSILPMLAGAAGGAMGIDPWMAAAGAGLVQGAITGNLEKGLTAGLSAYGGASLGRSFNPEGTFAGYQIGTKPSLANIDPGAAHGDVASSLTPAEATSSHSGFLPDGNVGSDSFAEWTAGSTITPTVAPTIPLNTPTPPAPQGMFDKFGAAASAGITSPDIAKFAPYAAGLGLAMPFLAGSNQTYKAPEPEKVNYAGPYQPMPRRVVYPTNRGPKNPRDSSEHMFFPDSNPYPGFLPADAFVAPTIRMAEGGLLPRAAPRTGLTAPEAPRYSGERTFNFPKSNYVPPAAVAAPTVATTAPLAGLAALTQQYPTATKAQVSELDRMIQAGGDPGANLSLMQAYSPAGSIKELQPWAKEYKGDSYRDSHPVDSFGNPIGWSLPAQTAPTTDANGVPSGWDPRDWANFQENYNPGMPDPEYIINNPWNYGTQALGVGDFLVSPSAWVGSYGSPGLSGGTMSLRSTGRTGSGSDGGAYAGRVESFKTAEQARRDAQAQERAVEAQIAAAMGDPNDYAESYPGSPVDPNQARMDAVTRAAQTQNMGAAERLGGGSSSSGSSTFLSALGNVIPSLSGATDYVGRQFSGAAPRPAPGATSTGPGLSDLYSGNRTLGSFTGFSSQPDPNAPKVGLGLGQVLNAATGYFGLPGTVIDFLRNTYGGGLASAPGTNTLGVVGNTITSPGIGAQLGAKFNRLLGGTNNNAAGGVNLEDGSFVVDARTVAELGNGSSGAGQEVLARLGGRPIHGPGDGVSDSIRANIGGTQEARVARDEVKFSPEAVKRLGRGNPKKGADRLYDMMKKAEKARKSASRGKDTGLRALAGAK